MLIYREINVTVKENVQGKLNAYFASYRNKRLKVL